MEFNAPATTATRVLIVDDEESIRVMAARVLHRAGYQTTVAADGPEALRIAEQEEPFDLLVADLIMPGMHGDELARRMLCQEPDLKVLYVTGYREQLFAERTTLGANETLLEKPATAPALIEAVSFALSGQTHRLVSGPAVVGEVAPFLADALAIMASAHPNVLLIGSEAAADRALTLMRPHMRTPILSWTPREARHLPVESFTSLVIRHVDAADRAQQAQLHNWLDGPGDAVQVVATTTAPLFPFILRGAFDEHLYYRLNQLCVDL
jgi:CheY-like chemotaxis protein